MTLEADRALNKLQEALNKLHAAAYLLGLDPETTILQTQLETYVLPHLTNITENAQAITNQLHQDHHR